MTDHSWPDYPGTFVGDDGTVYDVVISIQSDTVRALPPVMPHNLPLPPSLAQHVLMFLEGRPRLRVFTWSVWVGLSLV